MIRGVKRQLVIFVDWIKKQIFQLTESVEIMEKYKFELIQDGKEPLKEILTVDKLNSLIVSL